MKIINLIDNNEGNPNCSFEHGLSFYIETNKHKIICDTGQTNAFINNAKALNIDLSCVDVIFLSHGHYDHTGGLLSLDNNKAKVYLSALASREYMSLKGGLHYIGIDKKMLELPNLELIADNYIIDDELSIYRNPKGNILNSFGNSNLVEKVNEELIPDKFSHEQYLVVKENNQYYLFSGCCHRGIINVLNEFRSVYGCYPNYVISGFHFLKDELTLENKEIIIETAKELNKLDTIFYTCHCTGIEAYKLMKPILKDKIYLIKSGEEI